VVLVGVAARESPSAMGSISGRRRRHGRRF
jgi:hypothetical protein